jgi:hypothetical protein
MHRLKPKPKLKAKPRLSENIHYDGRCCASHHMGHHYFSEETNQWQQSLQL